MLRKIRSQRAGIEPRRPPRSRRSPNAGFTLLEVLAAFVVLALMTIAIQDGVVTAASGIATARARIGAQAVAASLAAGPLNLGSEASRKTSGLLNGYNWTIDVEALSRDRFGGKAKVEVPVSSWSPVSMRVEVRKAGHPQTLTNLETIRLVRTTR